MIYENKKSKKPLLNGFEALMLSLKWTCVSIEKIVIGHK